MNELLLHNGIIHTVDSQLPSAEAVCIQGERISFVGTEREARARASVSAQRIDLQGRTLIPGKPPLTSCWAFIILSIVWDRRGSIPEKLWRPIPSAAPKPEFREREKGSITAGKLADLAILSKDLLSVQPAKIKDIEVEMTIIGGRIVYQKEGAWPFTNKTG